MGVKTNRPSFLRGYCRVYHNTEQQKDIKQRIQYERLDALGE